MIDLAWLTFMINSADWDNHLFNTAQWINGNQSAQLCTPLWTLLQKNERKQIISDLLNYRDQNVKQVEITNMNLKHNIFAHIIIIIIIIKESQALKAKR